MKICKTEPDNIPVQDEISRIDKTIDILKIRIGAENKILNSMDRNDKIEFKRHLGQQKEMQEEIYRNITERKKLELNCRDLSKLRARERIQLKANNYQFVMKGIFNRL
jgi:hypothetical protein